MPKLTLYLINLKNSDVSLELKNVTNIAPTSNQKQERRWNSPCCSYNFELQKYHFCLCSVVIWYKCVYIHMQSILFKCLETSEQHSPVNWQKVVHFLQSQVNILNIVPENHITTYTEEKTLYGNLSFHLEENYTVTSSFIYLEENIM